MSLSDHTEPDHTQRAPQDSAATVPTANSAVPPAAGFGQRADTGGTYPYAGQPPAYAGQPVEIVQRGILFSLAAIPLGMAAAVLIWKLGFVASISSFLIAGAAVFLYAKGATTTPRRGMVPLIAVILVGITASFFAIVASDLVTAFNTLGSQETGYDSVVGFVSANLFYGPVLKEYTTDLLMFVAFAALGVFGTVRRLLGAQRAF